ncbi:hypothetical protein [Spirillospora albida]|nr:hypothetical protein [Spirillospora albida]
MSHPTPAEPARPAAPAKIVVAVPPTDPGVVVRVDPGDRLVYPRRAR